MKRRSADATPQATRRVFVALRVPAPLALELAPRVLAALGGTDAAGGYRLARPEGWHLTLHFLGDTPTASLERLARQLHERLHDARAPSLALTGTGAFPAPGRERVLWIGVEETGPARLLGLRERAQAAAGSAETPSKASASRSEPFRPHVTVARPRPGTRVPESFYALDPAAGGSPPAGWRASAVELMQSTRGEGAARYETLESFPLLD